MYVFIVSLVFCASLATVSSASTICGCNEIYVDCRQICPPQFCNISYTESRCDPPPDCEPGCNCIDNYLRDANNVCIRNDDCPPPPSACGENEVASDCKQVCPPQSCDWDPTKMACKPGPCQPGCNCIDGYLRNSEGFCIESGTCPEPPQECGENEVASDCKQVCPPQRCDWDPTKMACKPGPCQPGCNCIDGYLRNSEGFCIERGVCPEPPPKCGENEVKSNCKQQCPPQTCDWDPTKFACKPGPCQRGCNCIDGYLRNSDGICILKDTCPKDGDSLPKNQDGNDFESRSSAFSYATASSSSSASSYSSSFNSARSFDTNADPIHMLYVQEDPGTGTEVC